MWQPRACDNCTHAVQLKGGIWTHNAYISYKMCAFHWDSEVTSGVFMLFVLLAASALGTSICGAAYCRAHDWSCLENFVKEALACNLLCKLVLTAPSTPPLLSFSTHKQTHTHTYRWSRWCHWIDVRLLGNPLWKCWVMITRREKAEAVLESCTNQFSFSCEREHETLFNSLIVLN